MNQNCHPNFSVLRPLFSKVSDMGYFIALFILLIIASLAAAGFFMLRRPQDNAQVNSSSGSSNSPQAKRNMVRALTLRIGLSVCLFLCVLVAFLMGWISPTGLPITGK
jgi:archaellum biogenesis protein FlaJ (TadC family)